MDFVASYYFSRHLRCRKMLPTTFVSEVLQDNSNVAVSVQVALDDKTVYGINLK